MEANFNLNFTLNNDNDFSSSGDENILQIVHEEVQSETAIITEELPKRFRRTSEAERDQILADSDPLNTQKIPNMLSKPLKVLLVLLFGGNNSRPGDQILDAHLPSVFLNSRPADQILDARLASVFLNSRPA